MLIHFRTRIRSRTTANPFNPLQTLIPKSSKTLKMSAAQSDAKQKRPICPSCSKPARVCLCSRIRTRNLDNSISVTILQHSLERNHPLNSTRIAKLGLKNLNVVTVFEVDFEARFEIRLLEPGLGLIGPESSGFDQVREKGITQKAGFEVKGDGKCQDEKNRDLIDENENPCEKLDKGSHVDAINGGGVVINATMLKYGVVSHLSHIWKVDTHGKKPKFEHIVTSTMAKEALRGGFVVKKLGRKKLEGNMELELEESEEFEIKVPQGSVLLFPSQNAIGVDELKSMHFEVKNLIVLDGTWSKAGRVYNENPWLKLLPHLRLDLDRMSLYSEIRSQPKVGCLSTIESIVYSLKALGEKVDGLENLLDVFESMVGDQRRLKDERLSKRTKD
ncbi:hypothetical protein ES288_D05G438200v1 [Gossypium darwinii]|uniref:tRNA-uridine aminocarboxypropyltransferase n=1 Tax=Gossypium darwinii TaxID=34276 RepID=A0A5D2CUM0_GOSDA|nr:hypothetical protein ES288_D05G438200v1 [Gossypium darwinii]